MSKAYFDESYRIEEGHYPKTFCVAGYFLTDDAARAMEDEWVSDILECHDIPYFHMVDCAQGAPGTSLGAKPLEERVEIAKKCIGLIKKHTIAGFAAIASETTYDGFAEGDDTYADFVEMTVMAIDKFLDFNRVEDDVVFFFEEGHDTQRRAGARIAERIKGEPSRNLQFSGKKEAVLLQAADLLAWQCNKYVQDWHSRERGPRKDFRSLMEHHHFFFHVLSGEEEDSLGIELWPLSERAPFTTTLAFDKDGPVTTMREGDDPTPIIPVDRVTGWRMGGGRMAYVAFRDAGGNEFALAFDEPRIREAIFGLAAAMGSVWDNVPVMSVDKMGVAEQTKNEVVLGFEAVDRTVRLAIGVPTEVFRRFWSTNDTNEEGEGEEGKGDSA